MKVRFTNEARRCLRTIHAHIAKDSPRNALGMITRIIARAESLDEQYLRGRAVPEYEHSDIREIPEQPYRVIYRVAKDEIQILTVMHSRQLLPSDLPDRR